MRDYGRLSPTFWMRGTGKSFRGDALAQVVAIYLMSAPTSNMIGLYYLPISTISHDTGIPSEGASKALRRVSEGGFCTYHEESETVFVHSMAPRQLGLEESEQLSPKDNRAKAIVKMMRECSCSCLLQKFYETHREQLNLPEPWWQAPSKPLASPSEGGSKPPRSQDQDQDQDQDQEQESMPASRASQKPSEPSPEKPEKPKVKSTVKHSLPSGWAPKPSHFDKAKAIGTDCKAEAEAFKEHHVAKGNKWADWDMAFFTWLRNSEKFGTQREAEFESKPPPRIVHDCGPTNLTVEQYANRDAEYAKILEGMHAT